MQLLFLLACLLETARFSYATDLKVLFMGLGSAARLPVLMGLAFASFFIVSSQGTAFDILNRFIGKKYNRAVQSPSPKDFWAQLAAITSKSKPLAGFIISIISVTHDWSQAPVDLPQQVRVPDMHMQQTQMPACRVRCSTGIRYHILQRFP